jgi:hypothetical protein
MRTFSPIFARLSPEWNPGDLQLGKETLQPGRSCTPADRGNHFGQHQNIETIALDACTNLVSRRPWVTALGGARLTIYELSLHYRNKTQPNTNLKYSKLIKIPLQQSQIPVPCHSHSNEPFLSDSLSLQRLPPSDKAPLLFHFFACCCG